MEGQTQRRLSKKLVEIVGAAPNWHTAAMVDASRLGPEGLKSGWVLAREMALHQLSLAGLIVKGLKH